LQQSDENVKKEMGLLERQVEAMLFVKKELE